MSEVTLKQIIEGLYQINVLEKKIDLGSGPGILSYVLGEKTVNVDLNEYHFKQSIANPNNENIVASMHKLPVEDKVFDLALASNSLNYLSDKEKEQAVREANRVLKKGGYFILVLPYNVVPLDISRNIERGLARLGFDVIHELTGYVKSTSDVDFQAYIAVSKKIRMPKNKSCEQEFRMKKQKQIYAMRKKGICNTFSYFNPKNEEEEKLEARLEKYIKRVKIFSD